MIGIVISYQSNTVYTMRRITGSSLTTHTEQQLQSYLEGNHYRRIYKDKARSWNHYVGLWIADLSASDGDDAQAITEFMRTTEESIL